MKTQSLANRTLRLSLTISLLVAIVGLGTVAAQQAESTTSVTASSYTITTTDLGTLPGGTYSSAWAINNRSQIAGLGYDSNFNLVQVLWDNGTPTPLGSGFNAIPEAINDSREIVGTDQIFINLSYGVYWDPTGAAFALPPIPNGDAELVRAHDINNSGQIVGTSIEVINGNLGPTHAVLWQGRTLVRDLGVIGAPYGINDLGDIVGNGNNGRGFLWKNGSYTDLGSLNGQSGASAAYAINNQGVIAGTSNGGIAIVWRNGVIETLPALPGRTVFNSVTDLNNNNDVVGYGMASGDVQETGILWRNGQAIELGRLPGGTVSRAYGINDKGQIVGESNTPSLYFHGVLWTVSSSNGPAVTLVPTSLKWGKLLVGKTGGTKTITLTNTGSSTLNISSIVVTGDFTQKTGLKSCGATVAAGASCLIRVQFKPQQVGVRTGEVVITDDAPDSPQRVSLTGTGK